MKRPVLVAGIGVVVLAVIIGGLARLDTGPGLSTAGANYVGGDLHSVFAQPDGHVYIGGHDAVTATRDNGRSWAPIRALAKADAMAWAAYADALFVAGHPGARRSTDNGETFQAVSGLRSRDIHAFGAGPGVLVAAGPGVGIIASNDEGQTWQIRSKNEGRTFVGRIIVDPANPSVLLAADAQTGPTRSRDGGRTWTTLRRRASLWVSSPDGGTTIYSSSDGGEVSRSTDGGSTWQPIAVPAGAEIVEAAATGDGHHLYAAGRNNLNARLWVSFDGGSTWSEPAAEPR